jgi:PAS domain S-box-containing protein
MSSKFSALYASFAVFIIVILFGMASVFVNKEKSDLYLNIIDDVDTIHITNLEVEKNLNNLIFQKNYDFFVQKSKLIDTKLQHIQDNLRELDHTFDVNIDAIEKKFDTLNGLLDKFKTKNAILNNSKHAIIDLKQSIELKFIQDKAKLLLLSRMTEAIINLDYDPNASLEKLDQIQEVISSWRIRTLREKLLAKHLQLIVSTYKEVTLIKQSIIDLNIEQVIKRVEQQLYEELNSHDQTNQIMLYTLYGSTLLLLMVIIYFYRADDKLKKEIESLFHTLDDNVIFSKTDLKGRITFTSDALCDISNYSKRELLGQPHSILRHPDMPKDLFKDLWRTIQDGKTWAGVIKNRKKDGGYYWTSAIIESDFNSSGKHIGYISIRKDITGEVKYENLTKDLEQRVALRTKELEDSLAQIQRAKEALQRSKEEAEKATKAKSEFLAVMSHEIRTPLNAMLGFIELLLEQENDGQKREYLNIINNSGENLLEIIHDILDVSKIESGKIEIENSHFSTVKELESTQKLFWAKCSEKSIDLITTANNLPSALFGDITRIKQVVHNLLGNAIKFSFEEKKIYLTIDYRDQRLYVSVKDEGIGIDASKLAYVFEAFNQEDASTTRKYGGTGLGLTVSYNLVKLMGGELKVKSEVGVGSEFYFDIPIAQGDEEAIQEDNTVITKLDGHVLLVEDNKDNQRLMTIILEKLHITYDTANDGVEAVEMFKTERYDAILMDENMPNMNGIEATKQILMYERETQKHHTPIVALTANALKGDKERFLAAGMDAYLTKPINIRKLYATLVLYLKKEDGAVTFENDTGTFSTFETIDTQYGLRLVLGNEKIYTTVLKGLTQFKGINFNRLDDQALTTTMHTLKGLSASAGSSEVSQLAKQVETSLDRSLLAGLEEKLNRIIEEIELKLPKDEHEVQQQLSQEKRDELFATLKEAIMTKRAKNCNVIVKEIEGYVLSADDQELFQVLKGLIKKFKFKDALALF